MTEELLKRIEEYFEIESIEEGKISGKLREPKEKGIASLKEVFSSFGYFPFFLKEDEIEVIRLLPGLVQKEEKNEYFTPLILFILTILSTLFIGSFHQGGNPLSNARDLLLGIPFSFSLLLILGGHELGHYITAKKNGVAATLPHFLPVPHPLIGTMGAFIRIKSIIPSRRALIRVGVAGPLVGFLLAIPITMIGLRYSRLASSEEIKGSIGLGSSLLFKFLSAIFFPNIPKGYDILLSPMAFAGWLGFFVTAMNLLPIGQLDGGHIAYAIFNKQVKIGMLIMIGVLAIIGIYWPGWYFWLLLIFLFGLRHPPTQDEITGLGRKEIILAIIALFVFILTFTPFPFQSH